jgi:tetratricopeptide (TPR) repeat protein
MDPLNTQIYIYRGQVILEMGNLKLAAFCVQHASFLNEGGSRLRPKDDASSVRMLSSRGQRDLMTKSISRFSGFSNQTSQSTLSTTSNQSVTQRALVFSFLKNYNKAIAILDYDLKIKMSSDIFNLLGRVYMKAKNWEQAVITFEKSIEYNVSLFLILNWYNYVQNT